MAKILKGLAVANDITENLITECGRLKAEGIAPCLAIIRLGEREDDLSYERGALKRCEKIGIEVRHFLLPQNADKDSVLSVIKKVNEDDAIHGVLMFRPLPDLEIQKAACELLEPKKDVDSMTRGSLATVFSGEGVGFAPCTAEAVIRLLEFYDIPIEGQNICVIGRSLVIGKPVSLMLQSKNATVTMCHTRTKDLRKVTAAADILVVAAGKPRVVDETFVSPGQVIIDVGINVDSDGNLCGDVDTEKVEPIVSAITPVPGGVGSITTAVLASHVIEAAGL